MGHTVVDNSKNLNSVNRQPFNLNFKKLRQLSMLQLGGSKLENQFYVKIDELTIFLPKLMNFIRFQSLLFIIADECFCENAWFCHI